MRGWGKPLTAGRSPHFGHTVFLALLLLLGAMALSASSALALETRLPTGASLGPEGTVGSASFKSLQGVAVDPSTGNVYVHDAGEGGKLYKFDSSGAPADFSALSANVIEGVGGLEDPGTSAENQIAIAPPGSPGGTAGDIYLANGSIALQVYSAAGDLLGQIQGSGEVCGVAVDPAGHLFIGEYPEKIRRITPTTDPPTNLDPTAESAASLPFICNIAADGLGNVYASTFNSEFPGGGTAKLEGLADPTVTLIEPGGPSLAIDPASNELYLDTGSSIAFYSLGGALKGQFGAAGLLESRGIAIGATAEKAYVSNGSTGKVDIYGPTVTLPDVTTEPADAITKDSATLHGTISADGGPDASCEFQYLTEEAFQAADGSFQGATSVDCTPPGPFNGSGSEAVSVSISNLSVGTDYRFRVLGANANGSNPGQALSFLTLGPSVVSSTVTDITTTGATLTGFVNPRGKPFSYHFDYGPTESYGSSAPVPDVSGEDLPIGTGNIAGSGKIEGLVMSQGAFAVGQDIVGAGIKPGTTITAIEGSTLTLSSPATGSGSVSLTSTTVFVSQPISGLTPISEYHFRLVASNADATYPGPDLSFSTYPIDTGLPDGRVYEMVSPPQKIGEVFPPEWLGSLGGSCTEFCLPGIRMTPMPMRATPDGEAFIFEGQPFSPGLTPSGNQYLSERSASGWAASSITPPSAPGISDQSGFKAFSTDLTRGVLLQTRPTLSPEAPGEGQESFSNLYLWEPPEGEKLNLRPLITVEPPNRDPRPSGANAFELSLAGGNSGGGAAPAFTHLVFEANDALTGAVPTIAPAAPEVGEGPCGGSPASNGEPESDCNLYEWVGGQLRLINVLPGNAVAATHTAIGSGRRLTRSLGSDTAPETQAPNVDHAISNDGSRIFWSDASGQVYVRVEGKETVKIEDPGQFLTATPDGSKVLLSDGCLYNLEAEECEATLAGTPNGFLGILGASEDLSRIYFLSSEALAAGAQAGTCKTPLSDPGLKEEAEGKVPAGLGCNVYVYDHGTVSFIAALNNQDNNFGSNSNYGSWRASRSNRTAQVSPDGRYLAFMSYARLTGHDNRVVGRPNCQGAGIGLPCFEVFEYDLEAGSLHCASCNPSGERPLGRSNLSLILPEGTSFPQAENLPAEGEGRLFFESQDVLTTADTNGHIQDLFEWKPNGVGGCARAAGCIALISSGHSPVDSFFINSTASGNDTFFVTREQLLARDKDDLFDVYDARVNGGIAEEITPPCGGEACKGASSASPAAESPGTSTFNGPLDKKQKLHKHKKHRKHKAKKHKSKKTHKRSAQHRTGVSK